MRESCRTRPTANSRTPHHPCRVGSSCVLLGPLRCNYDNTPFLMLRSYKEALACRGQAGGLCWRCHTHRVISTDAAVGRPSSPDSYWTLVDRIGEGLCPNGLSRCDVRLYWPYVWVCWRGGVVTPLSPHPRRPLQPPPRPRPPLRL